MSDEGMDPCECMWNQELAMRRLLSLLRQTQAYCTDNECLEELPGLSGPSAGAQSNFLVMFLLMAVAVALYAMGPRVLGQRRERSLDDKPNRDGQGPSGAPPPPPPTAD